ncbi:MAG: hypothetical protein JRG86_17710 [Deltaproteobacteria bacterium]|nr:hypothetical protein [Deltaproteobacteria bacterium]MBW2499656.1 hypothetical protein [Deltaproteobacteria bacterium]
MASDHREPAPEGVEIGPVAHDLLFENADVKVWHVDTPGGETFWHHYHDLDYVLFHTSEMFGAVYHANEEHDRVWRSRLEAGETLDESLGGWCYEHSVNYIPGTGFLSPGYVNLGKTPFNAALVEVKRKRRPDQEGIGFARSDALVGMPARSGATMLLENDRIRVFETALDPGERSEPRRCLDTAIYVVDGGRIRSHVMVDGQSVAGEEEVRESVSGRWQPAAEGYFIENVGEGRYRELSVEIK